MTVCQNSHPFVSVVVNNYNYAEFVAEAVRSALQQEQQLVETIVVDDGSTDASREVLQQFKGSVGLILKPNGGQASALNAGFNVARGSWIVFLDADDLLCNDLAGIVARHAAPDVSKITWAMPIVGPTGRRTGQTLPAQAPEHQRLLNRLIELGPLSFVCSPCSGNVWSRTFLEQVFPIPESRFRRGADGYLLQTSPIYGRTVVASQPASAYRRHGSNFLAAKSEFEIRDTLRGRYAPLSSAVAEHLTKRRLDFDRSRWRHEHWERLDRLEAVVTEHIPADAPIVLVDDEILNVGRYFLGHPRFHLMADDAGEYAGPPLSGNDALEQLLRYAERGVRYVAFTWYAFWWLDYYDELKSHIDRACRVIYQDKWIIIYEL